MYRFLALFLLLPLLAPAQSQPNCAQMLRDGDAIMARRDPPLQEALRSYLNALNCNSQLAGKQDVNHRAPIRYAVPHQQKRRNDLAQRLTALCIANHLYTMQKFWTIREL